MLIVCPNCESSYQVQAAALGADGRSVRCANCKTTWFATPERMVAETAMLPVPVAAAANAEPPIEEDFSSHEAPFQQVIPPEKVVEEAAIPVTEAPPLVPDNPFATPADSVVHPFEPGTPDRPEAAAATRRVRRSDSRPDAQGLLLRRVFSLPMLIVVLLVVVLSALNWRASLVRYFPQTASLYAAIGLPVNLRGLFFEGVKSRTEVQDGVTVLLVEGMIVNLTTKTLDVPRLRLSLRNHAGLEVYAWTALPPKSTVGSGNGLAFRARLASPPPDGNDVIVRFFNRRDASAGLQ